MKRKTNTLVSLGIATVLITAGSWLLYRYQCSFGYGTGRWNLPGHMMMGNGGMGIIMIIFWLMVIVVVTLLLYGVLSDRGVSHRAANDGSEAKKILKQRYARGDIDRTQFEIIYQDLER